MDVGAWAARAAARLTAAAATILAAAGVAALAPAAAQAVACNDSWVNTHGGEWFNAENWSNGVPTSSQVVCITTAGTYTVTAFDTGSTPEYKSLAVGGGSGLQTLEVGSTYYHEETLPAGAISIAANGRLDLTTGDNNGWSVAVGGRITNAGTLLVERGSGGGRVLRGGVQNTGTFQVETGTELATSGTFLQNSGRIEVAEGVDLAVNGGAGVENLTGGTIAAAGGGYLYDSGGPFTENGGTTSGSDVYVDGGSLTYDSAPGQSTIALRGNSSLSGESSPGQSLVIQSTYYHEATISAPNFTNGGSLAMTTGDNNGWSDSITGIIDNTGTITSEAGSGGGRTINGEVFNSGAIDVQTPTAYPASGAALENDGQLTIANGAYLEARGGAAVDNGKGGSITGEGTGYLYLTEGTFTEGAGTASGTQPVIVDGGTLRYEGTGASNIDLRGNSTLEGATAAGQSLTLQSFYYHSAAVAAPHGFTNGGSLTMTTGDNNGWSDSIEGALTNSGTLNVQPGSGGGRSVSGNLVNTGTMNVETGFSYPAKETTFENKGKLSIATGIPVEVTGGASFANLAGGSIVTQGNGYLYLTGGTFAQGAGTTKGSEPVIVDGATLRYEGGGASTISLRGHSTLEGTSTAGQTLAVQSLYYHEGTIVLPSGFTNGGVLNMTTADNNGWNDRIEGQLTNTGTLATQPGSGGARELAGNVTNAGTLSVGEATTVAGSGQTLLNEGNVEVASGVTLTAGAGTIEDLSGSISTAGNGVLVQGGGTFVQGAGKITGKVPVVLEAGRLSYTGKGAGPIVVRGHSSVTGALATGQTLEMQSLYYDEAVLAAEAGFSNAGGTLVMSTGDNNGWPDVLQPASGTLVNKGTIVETAGSGGGRTIAGNLVNEKTVLLGAGDTLTVGGNLTLSKKGTLETEVVGSGDDGQLSASGTASVAGKLTILPSSSFTPFGGEGFGLIGSAGLTGRFTKVSGGAIKGGGVHYIPTYSATGAGLVAEAATLSVEPAEGPAGATVTLTGTGYEPNEAVKVTFKPAGAKKATTLAAAKASASGELSVQEKIPATAAKGAGTFTVTGKIAGTVTATFTVQ